MSDQKLEVLAVELYTAKIKHGITNAAVAQKLGWRKAYFSDILNGRRTSKNAEGKIRTALSELIAQKQNSPQ